MISKTLSLILFTVLLPLINMMAAARFNYIHPDDASAREREKIPKWASVIIRRHSLIKYSGFALLWVGACTLVLFPDVPRFAKYILNGMAIAGGVMVSVVLSWRLYAIVKRSR